MCSFNDVHAQLTYEVTHLVSGPLGVVDLFLDEDEVLDRGRLLQDVLELGQELVRRDDVGHLGLIGVSNGQFISYLRHFWIRSFHLVDSVGDGVVAEVGVEGDEREGLLEAAQRAHQPLLLRLREDAHVLPGNFNRIAKDILGRCPFLMRPLNIHIPRLLARLLQAYRHVRQ